MPGTKWDARSPDDGRLLEVPGEKEKKHVCGDRGAFAQNKRADRRERRTQHQRASSSARGGRAEYTSTAASLNSAAISPAKALAGPRKLQSIDEMPPLPRQRPHAILALTNT